jgi:predicted enzyme related to lactoylglutathione lyase
MPNALVHFEIPVNDLDRMSKFYSEAFGWNFQASPMGEGQMYWLITTGPEDKSLGGGMYKKQGQDELVRFYVGDENLDGASARTERAVGSLISRFDIPSTVTGALMYDPERNVFGIIKSIAPQSTTAENTSPQTRRATTSQKREQKKSSTVSYTKKKSNQSRRKNTRKTRRR